MPFIFILNLAVREGIGASQTNVIFNILCRVDFLFTKPLTAVPLSLWVAHRRLNAVNAPLSTQNKADYR